MKRLPGIFKALFFSIIFIQTIIIVSMPLIHMMNDSGWYYMNVEFAKTNVYVTESRYPSFDEPSQYYPFFGYSFFLFIFDRLAALLGIGVPMLVKMAQFFMYLATAVLVRKTIQIITQKETLSYLTGIAFLLYYPYFNYTFLVMSETYACFLLTLVIYLFARNHQEFDRLKACLMFLLAGCFILVKPVFMPISVMICVLFTIRILQHSKPVLLMCMLPVLVFPAMQSVFSKTHYDNYKLQTGFGWHMWDRVIFSDKSIPVGSEHLDELKSIYAAHDRPVSYGCWWDVTKDLSEFGYKELETQRICKNIALDGIRANPVGYAWNTLKNSYFNFLQIKKDVKMFCTLNEYLEEIQRFSEEQQHKPLTNQISHQEYYHSFPLNKEIIAFNCKYAWWSSDFYFLFHNSFVFLLFVLAGLHSLYVLIMTKFAKNRIEFLMWFSAVSTIVCSNMAEYPQPRLMLPAVIIVIMLLVVKINDLVVPVILRRIGNG